MKIKFKIYPSTDSKEEYLLIYKKLYKKYKSYVKKQQKSGEQSLQKGCFISTDTHFEYFLMEAAWKAIIIKLDAPLIESAKYRVGDKILFIKDKWRARRDSTKSDYKVNVECKGVISDIKISGDGTGEILYGIKKLTPQCYESNPFALEKNVLKLFK